MKESSNKAGEIEENNREERECVCVCERERVREREREREGAAVFLEKIFS